LEDSRRVVVGLCWRWLSGTAAARGGGKFVERQRDFRALSISLTRLAPHTPPQHHIALSRSTYARETRREQEEEAASVCVRVCARTRAPVVDISCIVHLLSRSLSRSRSHHVVPLVRDTTRLSSLTSGTHGTHLCVAVSRGTVPPLLRLQVVSLLRVGRLDLAPQVRAVPRVPAEERHCRQVEGALHSRL